MITRDQFKAYLEIASAFATLIAAVVLVNAVMGMRNAPAAVTNAPAVSSRPAPVTRVEGVELMLDASEGPGAGPRVVLIEFSDFECPYCGRHARETYPRIKSSLVDSGLVRYVFRHLPLERIHPEAFRAAEASECAKEQNRFWEMHDRLFADQKSLGRDALLTHARALGLDEKLFTACLAGTKADTVRRHLAEAERLGVNSTPTFFVGTAGSNGKVRVSRRIGGAQNFETIADTIQEVVKESGI